ncbi:MAG TPA: carbohydrate kinase family protein [Streptosporangiales bacterium]
MTTSTVLVAGDASWDVTTRVDHVPGPDEKVFTSQLVEDVGGVATNAAVAAALAGAAVRLATAVGDDRAGGDCMRRLGERQVTVDAQVSGVTTRVFIVLDRAGEKRLILTPGSRMYPPESYCESVDLTGVSWLHTAAYDRAASTVLVGRCRGAGIPWSLDLEPATLVDGVTALAPVLDGASVVFCNERATHLLGDHPVAALRALGVRTVVLTRGRQGADLSDGARTERVAAPRLAEVVDTTGAGDCLAGSFVAQVSNGARPEDALAYAVTAASLSCTALGGQSAYPSGAVVRAALARSEADRGVATS